MVSKRTKCPTNSSQNEFPVILLFFFPVILLGRIYLRSEQSTLINYFIQDDPWNYV